MLLCLFIIVNMFYQGQSNRVNSLAMESVEVLAEWNDLGNRNYGLLVDRFTQYGDTPAEAFTEWEEAFLSFEKDLDQFIGNPSFSRQPEMQRRLDGAYRVWRYTRVRLNTANEYLTEIIESGLGETVFVNGMLHTMYQLRMEDQLSIEELLLLEDAINALDNLEKASDDFDLLFKVIIEDMKADGQRYLQRMRLLIIAIFSAAALVLFLSYYLQRSVSRNQESRSAINRERRKTLYRNLLENSTQETIQAIISEKEEISIPLEPKDPILLVLLQIDDFRKFSHAFNIAEQQELISNLCSRFLAFLNIRECRADHLEYHDDMVVFLINGETEEALDALNRELMEWSSMNFWDQEFSCSMTIGEVYLEPEDIDQEFSDLLKFSEYRYTMGKQALIKIEEIKSLIHDQEFKYPQEKERQFLEACKALDIAAVKRISHEMLSYGREFGPECAKRLVLRLSAAQSNVIEQLIRSFNIEREASGSTTRILEIQGRETLVEAEELLCSVIENIIEVCDDKRHNKQDQVIIKIKELIKENLTDFNLSADMIGDEFKLSASYINRVFKQQTSMSIAGFINDQRLVRADELILEGHITIADAAAAAGFASTGTFFRLYKKRFGQTPGERVSGIFS